MATVPKRRRSSSMPRSTHIWPFGALAELVCSASTDSPIVRVDTHLEHTADPYLSILDHGPGHTLPALHHRLRVPSPTVRWHQQGAYASPWQAAALRIAADILILTKLPDQVSHIALLSRNRLADGSQPSERDAAIIREWSTVTPSSPELRDLLAYSPWSSYDDINTAFEAVPETGTLLILHSLRCSAEGTEPELDFTSDPRDVLCRPTTLSNTRSPAPANRVARSLRAYLELLFLRPAFRIILRGAPVRPRRLRSMLWGPVDFCYTPRARMLEDGTPGADPGRATIRLGFDPDGSETEFGMLLYCRGRLIRPYLKVGLQLQYNADVRVVGIIEAEFVTPTPNMQSFERDKYYQGLLLSLDRFLKMYWVRYGSMAKVTEVHAQDPVNRWVQCDNCGKWRIFSPRSSEDPTSFSHCLRWVCSMNHGGTTDCTAPDDEDVRVLLHKKRMAVPGLNLDSAALPHKRPRTISALVDPNIPLNEMSTWVDGDSPLPVGLTKADTDSMLRERGAQQPRAHSFPVSNLTSTSAPLSEHARAVSWDRVPVQGLNGLNGGSENFNPLRSPPRGAQEPLLDLDGPTPDLFPSSILEFGDDEFSLSRRAGVVVRKGEQHPSRKEVSQVDSEIPGSNELTRANREAEHSEGHARLPKVPGHRNGPVRRDRASALQPTAKSTIGNAEQMKGSSSVSQDDPSVKLRTEGIASSRAMRASKDGGSNPPGSMAATESNLLRPWRSTTAEPAASGGLPTPTSPSKQDSGALARRVHDGGLYDQQMPGTRRDRSESPEQKGDQLASAKNPTPPTEGTRASSHNRLAILRGDGHFGAADLVPFVKDSAFKASQRNQTDSERTGNEKIRILEARRGSEKPHGSGNDHTNCTTTDPRLAVMGSSAVDASEACPNEPAAEEGPHISRILVRSEPEKNHLDTARVSGRRERSQMKSSGTGGHHDTQSVLEGTVRMVDSHGTDSHALRASGVTDPSHLAHGTPTVQGGSSSQVTRRRALFSYSRVGPLGFPAGKGRREDAHHDGVPGQEQMAGNSSGKALKQIHPERITQAQKRRAPESTTRNGDNNSMLAEGAQNMSANGGGHSRDHLLRAEPRATIKQGLKVHSSALDKALSPRQPSPRHGVLHKNSDDTTLNGSPLLEKETLEASVAVMDARTATIDAEAAPSALATRDKSKLPDRADMAELRDGTGNSRHTLQGTLSRSQRLNSSGAHDEFLVQGPVQQVGIPRVLFEFEQDERARTLAMHAKASGAQQIPQMPPTARTEGILTLPLTRPKPDEAMDVATQAAATAANAVLSKMNNRELQKEGGDMSVPVSSGMLSVSHLAISAAVAAAAAATAASANGKKTRKPVEISKQLDGRHSSTHSPRLVHRLLPESGQDTRKAELFKTKLQELIYLLAPGAASGMSFWMRNIEELDVQALCKEIQSRQEQKARDKAECEVLEEMQSYRMSQQIACESLQKVRRLIGIFLNDVVGVLRKDEDEEPVESQLEDYLRMLDALPAHAG